MNIQSKINELHIPVVMEHISSFNSINELIDFTRPLEDEEGFVITFSDGHRVKIKADQYVLLHKTLDKIRHDRHIVLLMLDNKLDDVIALLPQKEQERIQEFESWFWYRFDRSVEILEKLFHRAIDQCGKNDRKCVALEFLPNINMNVQSFIFGQMNGKKAHTLFLEYVRKQCSSNKAYDGLKNYMKKLRKISA
jgi:RNA ligase